MRTSIQSWREFRTKLSRGCSIDVYHERLESIAGFTVNLAWIRERYFSELVSEVSRIGESGTTLEYAVLDDHGNAITGTIRGDRAAVREFPLQFFDPSATELDGEEQHPARLDGARERGW